MTIANNTLVALDRAAGQDISKTTNFDDIIKQSGFDFEVEKVPVHDPEGEEITNRRLLRRADNHKMLGIVSNRYVSVDTKTMLEPFHELVTLHQATYESAGVIGGGKKCWISATLPSGFSVSGREDDVIQQRIVALINHDGLGKNAYFSLANRIVCNNQLRLITNTANASEYGVTHTKNWESRFEQASAGFKLAMNSMVNFERTVKQLNDMPMKQSQIDTFGRMLYKIDKKTSLSPQAVKRTNRLKELFKSGHGNHGQTRWDALNAVTEMLDHRMEQINKSPSAMRQARQNRFFRNNLSGYGDMLKQRAVRLLIDNKNTFK